MTTTYALPIARARSRSRAHAVPALWRQVVRGAALDRGASKGDDRVVQPGVVEPDRSAYTQLEIYEGLLRAFDRRAQVLDAIASAPDRDAAVLRVRDLLDVTHLQATAILDLQLHRFAAGARDRIAHRAAELRHALIG
jgi:ABC-type glutathione transport system ATPase component